MGQMIVIATNRGIWWQNYHEELIIDWQRAKFRKKTGKTKQQIRG